MKWIRLAIFGVLLAAAGVFLVRGTPRVAADVPADFVVVRYWEKWTGNEGAQMRQIVDEFNATVGRAKKIHVAYMSMSNIDHKTLVATAAGVPPDIAGLWDQQVAQYAALGAAEPLDELAAAYGIGEQTYLPVYWNACRYDNKLYALVSTPAAIALHYNKQLFHDNAAKLRAAGLDPDRPPQSLAELDRYAEVLDQRNTHGRLDRAGYLPLQSWYVPFTVYWFGGELFDPASQRLLLDSPESIRAFEWIASYSRRLSIDSVQGYLSGHPMSNFDSPQNPFLTGTLVMQQQGPWMANYIKNLKPSMSQVRVPSEQEGTLARRTDNYAWAVASFPAAVPGLKNVTYCSFDILMIPTGARHKKEAFEFIAYVNRQDVSEKLNTLHCKNTQLRDVSPEFFERHPNPYIKVFQELAASPNARGVPPVPIWPEVAKQLNDAGQAVALRGADPRAVLTAAQQRLQAQYDQFRRIQEQRQRL
jgi:ABC-type glycerol-3-phosphate transport system substrate-binding protein